MLRFAPKALVPIVTIIAITFIPISAISGGVVTEGVTTEDSTELSLINVAFGADTGGQIIVTNEEAEAEAEAETETNTETDSNSDDSSDDTTSEELFLWMSSVFGGHDAAVEPDSSVEGNFEVSTSPTTQSEPSATQTNAVGGCAAVSSSTLSCLIGFAVLIRRRRFNAKFHSNNE